MTSMGWRSLMRGDSGRLFGLLCVLNLLNYIDRQAVTGLLEPIRKDLGATDAQMGLVGSAFLLTYTLLPPVFGWLGDRVRRTTLLAGSAAVWCLATALCGLVRWVGQLAVARGLVGIGEASYMATSPSLLADLFPERARGKVLSIFYAAAPIGAALGVALGGAIAARYGWRAACFLVGLQGLAAAALLFRAKEPVRGGMDGGPAAPPAPPILATARILLARPAFILLTLALAGHVFVQNAVEYWLPTILQRDKAIPITEANATYGLMVFVAGIVGPLVGAMVGDWLAARTRRGYYVVAGAAIALVTVPLAVIAISETRVVIFGSVLVEALLGNAASGLVLALAVAQVGAEIRGTTVAIMLTAMHLLGDSISWPLVGWLSTTLQEGGAVGIARFAESVGVTGGHHLSMALAAVAVPAAILSALLYLASSSFGVRASRLEGTSP